MDRLAKDFPPGVAYSVVYNPTDFIQSSVDAVVRTLFEAVFLVVIVVILFLQTWRAAIIPIVAIPVSLIGTFAVMAAVGISFNTLSLFGLVLAIGIVVDDAIVVVENASRNIERGMNGHDAAIQATKELLGPIIGSKVARQSCKKSSTTMNTSTKASISVCTTAFTDSLTKTVGS